MKGVPSRIAIWFIGLYQRFISPLLGDNCRFYPSCSSYAREGIEKFGLARGAFLAFIRIMKCGPWHSGGYDPVPDEYPSFLGRVPHQKEYYPKGR
jgi:hypothetical protein